MPLPRGFQKWVREAQTLIRDRERLLTVLTWISKKTDRSWPSLKGLGNEIKTLVRMVQRWAARDYPGDPKTIALVVGALLYFLNPFDLIPDFIVGGLFDDVALLTKVIASLSGEIARFREWEENQDDDDSPDLAQESD